ncbi:MAG: sensor histidine kinase [Actinomycetota bacterium]|nr:MAG: sensor histidine kinase [Actinomycetota bacterium]
MAVEGDLWRALTAFRVLAVGYAVVLYAVRNESAVRPALGWIVLAAMVGWTVVTTVWYARPSRRRGPALLVDLAVGWAALAGMGLAVGDRGLADQTIPVLWAAAAVVACGLGRGPLAGLLAGLATGAVVVAVRGGLDDTAANNVVLLVLAGSLIGWIAQLSQRAAAALAAASAARAQEEERDRLGRAVHDGVLQVLDLVHLRAPGLGPEGAELARLAAEQEAALRALIATGRTAGRDLPGTGVGNAVDVAAALAALGSVRVSVAVPADAVPVSAWVAGELVAAVRAALDNVVRHAGTDARAWVLLEDEDGDLLLSVRDDGPGVSPQRLRQAHDEGRLGVSGSIVGRVVDLGGAVVVGSGHGTGTEVEIRLPRTMRDQGGAG